MTVDATSVSRGNTSRESEFFFYQATMSDPAFKKWLRKAGLVTGLAGTKEEQMAGLEEYKHATCEKWKKELMSYSQYLVRCLTIVHNPYLIVMQVLR